MSIDATAIMSAVASHAAASGHFDRVTLHEPKNKPGNGLSAAVWVQYLGPVPAGSSLRATSAVVTVNVRVMSNMLTEPQDEIDPNVLAAVDALMAAYSGDFELGGLVRNVDLLGQSGQRLEARAGYLPMGNPPVMYRVMTVNVPMIVNDAWEQAR